MRRDRRPDAKYARRLLTLPARRAILPGVVPCHERMDRFHLVAAHCQECELIVPDDVEHTRVPPGAFLHPQMNAWVSRCVKCRYVALEPE